MTQELTYEQTIELEKNIQLKNKAEEIYTNFLRNVKLNVKSYKGRGVFMFWSDSHNYIYFTLVKDTFHFQCDFLHESYDVEVTPSGIFHALQNKNRGVEHLEVHVK